MCMQCACIRHISTPNRVVVVQIWTFWHVWGQWNMDMKMCLYKICTLHNISGCNAMWRDTTTTTEEPLRANQDTYPICRQSVYILRCAKSTGEARKRERLYFTAFIHTFFFYFSARFFFAFLTRLLIGCVCAFPNQVWINMHKTYCMSRERFVYLVSHACHDDDDGAVVKLAAISKIDSPAVILTDTQCRQRKMCTHHECWKWAKEKLESIICYVANGGF